MPYFAMRFISSTVLATMIVSNAAYCQLSAQTKNVVGLSTAPPVTKSIWINRIPILSGEPVASGIGRRTIVHVEDKTVKALDSNTGKLIWAFDLSPYSLPRSEKANQFVPPIIACAPVITNDIVYITFNQSNISMILALERQTGTMKWRFDPYMTSVHSQWSGQILSPPHLWRDRLIFRTALGLTAIKTSNGEILWNCCMDPEVTTTGAPSASPTSDKYLYFNSDFGVAYAFDPLTGHCIWKTPTDGKVITGVINVHKINIIVAHCQPLRLNSYLIVADGAGNIYALDSNNGTIKWKVKPAGYTFQFVSYRGAICAATDKGLFELDPRSGNTIKQYQFGGYVLSCLVMKDKAILTKYPSGWEVFDLRDWKTVVADTKFSPRINVSTQGDMFFLSGYTGDGAQPTNELRAYRLQASDH